MKTFRAAIALIGAMTATAAAPPKKPDATQQTVNQWMSRLTLAQKVAQLVIAPCYGDAPSTRSPEYRKYARWVSELRIGGLIVLNRVGPAGVRNAEPHAMAVFLNRMQKLARVPLIVGADFERGSSMRVAGSARFPYNMAYAAARDLEATRYLGAQTAREARALGVHWVFAPVADVNNNPDNPIINIRSYGQNPDEVSAHVRAYIEGARSDPANRVLVSAKHFPGHGDTGVDSHLNLPKLEVSRERLEQIELKPFRSAISSGVDAIMTAHMAVPALEPEEIPATVSPKVLTALLRNQLGFQGLVVTDAMDMQGLTKQFNSGEGAVRALLAGADVLLMPPRPEESINAVLAAIQKGRLSRKRIEASVSRVLAAKARAGLAKKKLTDPEAVSDVIDSDEAREKAQQISDRAVTLLRNEGDLIPVKRDAAGCLIVMAERRGALAGQTLSDEFRRRAPGWRQFLLDPTLPEGALGEIAREAAGCERIVAAAFVTVSAYRGDVALPGGFAPFVSGLTEGKIPVALVSLGNPYLVRSFPKAAAYLATFSPTQPSELSAVKALFGEIAIGGKTPVAIPGIAGYGDGIRLGVSAAGSGR